MRGIGILLSVVWVACGAQSPSAPVASAPSTPEPSTESTPEPEPVRTAPADPPARVRIVLDVARHPERASLWFGETEVVQLGSIAGARHSMGTWSTSAERRTLGGESVLGIRARQGRIPFFVGQEGTTRIELEGRTIRPGAVQLFVDGDRVEVEGELPTRGWGTIVAEVPELSVGEHLLMVRGRGSSTVEGSRIGLALRRLEIGPDAPDVPDAIGIQEDRVQLRDGWKVRFPLVVPPGARLVGQVEATTHVRAVGQRRVDLGVAEPGRLDVDLSALADTLTYLEFEGGAITNPVIVRPDDDEANEVTAPRNVLMVLIDTLRADRLSPYNPDTRVQTPGLNAFVQSASTFAHAHSQENWTKPSVATLLSGLMPWEHTATGQSSVVPRSVELLPEVLDERGFATASFISNGYVSDRFGFRQGWDTYRNYLREGRRNRAENVAADVLAWLDGRAAEGDTPFFAYVHTIDPHVPYRPPNRYLGLYGDTDYRGPVNFRADSTLLENVKLGRVRLAARDREHLQALYDGEITYHDVHFRAILDGLERRGLADNTMVVVTSDHGEEFWDHGSVGHGHSVYEELLHVPLFVKLPGVPARQVEASVGLVDVMPTILDALGIEAPDAMSGRSFLPELRGAGTDAPRASVSGFMENWRTVTDQRFKLILRPRRAAKLYDLDNDPQEANDIAASHPWTVRYLRELLAVRLDATRGRQRRTRHRATRTRIDDETAAQLRAIGYVVD